MVLHDVRLWRVAANGSVMKSDRSPPQQTSERLRPSLAERLHSRDGKVAWNDHHGRILEVGGPRDGMAALHPKRSPRGAL